VGPAYLNNIKSSDTLESLFSFAKKNKIIDDKKNNLNFLNSHASRVGQLLLGNTSKNNCQPFSSIDYKEYDLVMSFSSEVISKNCFKDTYKVYFGHHGDEGAMCADIVLPTPLYTEKNGIFVNIEGRPQEAKKCHNPIGLAKEEWTILKELSNQLSLSFEIESFEDLRSKLSQEFPDLMKFQQIIELSENSNFDKPYNFENCSISYPIENFYMSDVISKNSITMAKCVEEILPKPLLEKTA
jgi:NADH-quinone oxidoreductase subunit G